MFSVIIPNFNQKNYVRDAIESVLAQSYQEYEIIVVDDGSTDGSKAIVYEYGSRVRYIWQENQGLAGARNTGIRASQGEFIALLDADDQWLPEYLETMVLLIDKYSEAAVYYCGAQCINASGKLLPQLVGLPAKQTTSKQDMYERFIWANFLIPSTVTLRRSVVVDAGYFDQSLRSCEDWDMWLRILPARDFIGTDKVLVQYRVHEQSLSADVTGMHNAKRAVVEKHFGLDDGRYGSWSSTKRLAYAGLFRYFLVTSVQRRGDWQAASRYLSKCFAIDQNLSMNVNLFYELALGTQPTGYRNTAENLALEDNAMKVMNLLDAIFQADHAGLESIRVQAYSTACYAIGLCAYNTNDMALSRKFLSLAGRFRPELWFSYDLASRWIKSWLGNRWREKLHRNTYI